MGLDMHLYGKKNFYALPDEVGYQTEDGFRKAAHVLELGYWRKHPNLHGYIVQKFAAGVDDCREVPLDREDLKDIIRAVMADELPETTGFFFGKSDGSEKAETLQILTAALSWLTPATNSEYRSVHYRASW
jgi:hypothetical protein